MKEGAGKKKRKREEDEPIGFRHKRVDTPAWLHATSGIPAWVGNSPCEGPTLEERLTAEIEDYVRFIRPTNADRAMRDGVIAVYRRALVAAGRGLSLEVFGSCAAGMYLPGADLDFVVLEASEPLNPEKGRMASRLSKLAKAIYPHASELMVIKRARIPIIQLTDGRTQLKIDISYQQPGGIRAAELVREMYAALPALGPLSLVLKLFLKNRNLHEYGRGGIGGFALVCWLAAFIQMHPIVFPDRYRDGREDATLGALLMDFFHYFGSQFDYHRIGLSPSGGNPAPPPPAPASASSCAPAPTRSNAWTFLKSEAFKNPQQPYLLCLRDPLTPENDLARGSYRIQEVSSAFHAALSAI
ncbi:hypothetical protein BDK51DRAFT_23203, partial [Blyttiomyces helicus]